MHLQQVYVGREKEAVSDMLPYLRLGYVTDPSEMQSVVSSQGPICPVSRLNRFLVHFLFWKIEFLNSLLIEDARSTILSLEIPF